VGIADDRDRFLGLSGMTGHGRLEYPGITNSAIATMKGIWSRAIGQVMKLQCKID